MAYIYPFRMASGTATMVLIDPRTEEVVGGIRKASAWVYPGYNSMSGGFMEARYTPDDIGSDMSNARGAAHGLLNMKYIADEYHEGENLEECAVREIEEEFGIKVSLDQLNLFDVRSNSRTDTRAHVINACYFIVLDPEQANALPDGKDVSMLDDLESVKRMKISEVQEATEDQFPMAFNHFEIMQDGIKAWQKERRILDMEGELIALRAELAQARADASRARSDAQWEVAGRYGQQGGA